LSRDKATEKTEVQRNLMQLQLDVEDEKKEREEDETNQNSNVATDFFENDDATVATNIVALDSLRYSDIRYFHEVDYGMKDCFRAIHVLRDYFPDINNSGVVFRFKENDEKLLFKSFDETVEDSVSNYC